MEETKQRKCKFGEPCWLATVSKPDICARLARTASRGNSLQGSDVYGTNDLVESVRVWQQAAISKYPPSSRMDTHARGDVDRKTRQRGEKKQCGTMTPVVWSDATYSDQSANETRRVGYDVGLTSSTLRGPRHALQWTPKYTRKSVKSRSGWEAYASSEIVDHTSPLRELYAHSAGSYTGMAGLGNCEIHFIHVKNKKAESSLIRRFPATQQALEMQELADGIRRTKRHISPLTRLLESGAHNPGALRPLQAVAPQED